MLLAVSSWSGNELEYLRTTEYPACITNDVPQDVEFAVYLSRAFNGSFIWNKQEYRKYGSATFSSTLCASINIVARRMNGRHNSGSSVYFQVTHKSQFQLVKCGGTLEEFQM